MSGAGEPHVLVLHRRSKYRESVVDGGGGGREAYQIQKETDSTQKEK